MTLNTLVGNGDAHTKNFWLLHERAGYYNSVLCMTQGARSPTTMTGFRDGNSAALANTRSSALSQRACKAVSDALTTVSWHPVTRYWSKFASSRTWGHLNLAVTSATPMSSLLPSFVIEDQGITR
jgi:hypothetical protein